MLKAVKLILSTEFAGSESEIGIKAPFAGWLTVTVAAWSYDKNARTMGYLHFQMKLQAQQTKIGYLFEKQPKMTRMK